MGITENIYDAADKYGLDNMSVTPSLLSQNSSVLGSAVSTTNSWTGNILVGQHGIITINLSGGFIEKIGLVYTDTVNGVFTDMTMYKAGTNELLINLSGSIPFTASTISTALLPQNLLGGNDIINGSSHNNIVKGFSGSDRIDGGGGTDTVLFSGFSSQYLVNRSGNSLIASGPDGVKTLVNIERLQFDDKAFAFDADGNGGKAYRLYQASFNHAPDSAGLGFQMNALDSGWSLPAVAQNFIDSPEFSRLYGSLDTNQFVTQLYANVLHRVPDTEGLAFHTGNLESHALTRADVLVGFSESPENQALLIGVIQNGMEYVPSAG